MKKLILLAIGFSGLIAGCGQSGPSSVEIRNEAGVRLADLEVEVGGRKIHVAPIDPGHVAKVEFTAVSDSGLRIRYRRTDEPPTSSCDGDVYVTTGLRQHLRVNVDPNGGCEVKELPFGKAMKIGNGLSTRPGRQSRTASLVRAVAVEKKPKARNPRLRPPKRSALPCTGARRAHPARRARPWHRASLQHVRVP